MTDRPKTGPVERAIRKACVIAFDVPKNRQGRVGEMALSFEGRYQRWQESSACLAGKEDGPRDRDDRRLCLECAHLSGRAGAMRCARWQRAGLGQAGIPSGLVLQLQSAAASGIKTP